MDNPTLTIMNTSGEKIEVEVETTSDTAKQLRGLRGRTELTDNARMLSVFDQEQQQGFTAEDAPLTLSTAHINAEGYIVDIQDL